MRDLGLLVLDCPGEWAPLVPFEMEVTTMMDPRRRDVRPESLPPACLGPDGKLPRMSEEVRRQHLESVRRRLAEIGQMTGEDPPGAFEEFLRGIDEGRPHRPMYKGYS